jgi:hypothetical protein
VTDGYGWVEGFVVNSNTLLILNYQEPMVKVKGEAVPVL